FHVGTVPPGGSGTITGMLSVFGGGEREAVLNVQCFVEEQQICAEEAQGTLTLFYPNVTVLSSIAGTANASFKPNEPALYRLEYTNNESEDIVGLAIELAPPASFFSLDAKTKLRFTPETTPALAVVKKGRSGFVETTIPIRSDIDRTALFGEGEPMLVIPYIVRYRLASRPNQEIVLRSEDKRRVATDLSVDAFARYFSREGDQLGRGPLPPVVGEPTRYWTFIALRNSFSDASNVVVRAHLPDHVLWTGKTSVTLGEPMQFDDRTRELLWRVGNVTRFTGGVYPDVGVAVELSLTPEPTHVGTSPVLLDGISVTGSDTFTNTAIEQSGPNVTTNLTVDTKAKGKGVVGAE
ncbi:MAG: hypothetical protein Q7R47_02465, partial [Candidatus Diapherotrites archaeon]|nr:hypothetical protein [Candidatus Diapherotrites archaeon]